MQKPSDWEAFVTLALPDVPKLEQETADLEEKIALLGNVILGEQDAAWRETATVLKGGLEERLKGALQLLEEAKRTQPFFQEKLARDQSRSRSDHSRNATLAVAVRPPVHLTPDALEAMDRVRHLSAKAGDLAYASQLPEDDARCEAFRAAMLQPLFLAADATFDALAFPAGKIGSGWVSEGAENRLSLNVPVERIRSHILLAKFLVEVLEKGTLERTCTGRNNTAFSEHTLDQTIHSRLMLGPWLDCIAVLGELGCVVCYGSDQPIQGEANQLFLLGQDDVRVHRLDVKPDSFLFLCVEEASVLMVHSEHKADGSSVFEKARSTALAQFSLFCNMMDRKDVIVPFLTIGRTVVDLFVIVDVSEKPMWSRVHMWNVGVLRDACSLLAAMYRLMEWVRDFGAKVESALPKVARDFRMELLGKVLIERFAASTTTLQSKEDSGADKSVRQNVGASKKTIAHMHDEAVAFLHIHWDAQLEEQCPRGGQVVDEGPWHFASADQSKWAKVFAADESERGRREADNLRLLAAEGVQCVPRLLETWETASGCVVIAMEHCGACVRHVESWGELERRAVELVEALAAVHRAGRCTAMSKRATCARWSEAR
jgi:hypothetical protein